MYNLFTIVRNQWIFIRDKYSDTFAINQYSNVYNEYLTVQKGIHNGEKLLNILVNQSVNIVHK